jgi:carbonic anhydrase
VQFPIAAILSCADSRVAPEFAFDQGPGDLFVVRLAGNFANDDGLASLEYAVKFLGVPLVLVLGHSNCGAVSSAIRVVEDNAEPPGHLPGLVQSIKPAVEAAKAKSPKDLSRGGDHRKCRAERETAGNRAALASGSTLTFLSLV